MSETKELVLTSPSADVVRAEDFLPLLTVDQAIERKSQINKYISGIMVEGDDYGKMPGDNRKDAKKVLLKPGAEKLCSVFGLVPQYAKETVIEDWTGVEHAGEPLFYYEYRCYLSRGGRVMGEAIGSANSWETKYRYRWVSEEVAKERTGWESLPKKGGKRTLFEPQFALQKKEAIGQYGKPAEYWAMFESEIHANRARSVEKTTKAGKPMLGWEIDIDQTLYRIPNPETADCVNTLQKMAQKRALVAAVLVVTNCSDAFTQDMEDFEHGTAGDTESATSLPDGKKMEPTGIPIPANLALLMNEWKAGGKNPLIEGLKVAKDRLLVVLPQNGEEEYHRVLDGAGVKSKGNDNAVLLSALLQLWTLAEQLAAKSMPQKQRTIDVKPEPVWGEYKTFAEAPDPIMIEGRIRVGGKLFEANDDKTAFREVK